MTDPTLATPEEMLSALEKWARARGFKPNRGAAWCVGAIAMETGHRSGLLIQRRGADGKYSEAWENVSPEIAVAWALTVEAGLEAVDVGACSACQGTGSFWWDGEDCHPPGVVACPDCDATGRIRRDPARVVLDAAPQPKRREWTAPSRRPDGIPQRAMLEVTGPRCVATWTEPGDPKAIEALTALADHLQPHAFDDREPNPAREAAGHALAHLVALWLDGDLRETRVGVDALTRAWERLTVPCERCEGKGEIKPKERQHHRYPNIHESSAVEVGRDEHGDSALAGWLASRPSRRRARRRR